MAQPSIKPARLREIARLLAALGDFLDSFDKLLKSENPVSELVPSQTQADFTHELRGDKITGLFAVDVPTEHIRCHSVLLP